MSQDGIIALQPGRRSETPSQKKKKTQINENTIYVHIIKINIVKMSILSNMIYIFNVISIKFSVIFFKEIVKLIL